MINFGRLARSGAQATAASLPKADAKGPSTTNSSVPAASRRRAHKGDRLTKGSDPVFKATIIKLQGEKVILENELRALYERTGEAVPKATALPKKSRKNGAKRAKIAPPQRVPIGAGPEAPKDLSGQFLATWRSRIRWPSKGRSDGVCVARTGRQEHSQPMAVCPIPLWRLPTPLWCLTTQ